MTIRQGRYILAETDQERRVRVTEIQRAEEDPFIRKSEIQQTVNNSTLPVSSRAVNLVIEDKIASGNLANKQYVDDAVSGIEIPSLDGYATKNYVDQKFNSVDLSSYASITYVDEKFNSIDLSGYLTIGNANQTYSTKAELAEKWNVQETVGNPSGKVMREGAYGLGGSMMHTGDGNTEDLEELLGRKTSFFVNNHDDKFITNSYGIYFVNGRNTGYRGVLSFGWTGSKIGMAEFTSIFPGGSYTTKFITDKNTTTDKNGVLHIGRGTPINTLNVSDMSDTVVDNDMLTVTSGAVFRAIKQLTDQITSLETRVRELEDGGI